MNLIQDCHAVSVLEDMACGRSTATPILFFDLAAERQPFVAKDLDELFPSRGRCEASHRRKAHLS